MDRLRERIRMARAEDEFRRDDRRVESPALCAVAGMGGIRRRS